MKLSVIDEEPKAASLQLAINDACFEAVKNKEFDEIFRVYRFLPGVILSKYQDRNDLHEDPKVEVTRRKTGGGAVYVGSGMLGYSLFLRSNCKEKDSIPTHEPYTKLTNAVCKVLNQYGLPTSLVDHWGVEVNDRMIAGHAQRYEGRTFEVHGLLAIEPQEMQGIEKAIKLRTHITHEDDHYLLMCNNVYDKDWNQVNLNAYKVFRDEAEELQDCTCLRDFNINELDFSKTLANELVEKTNSSTLPTSILSNAAKYVDGYISAGEHVGVVRRGLGHCYVDLRWNH